MKVLGFSAVIALATLSAAHAEQTIHCSEGEGATRIALTLRLKSEEKGTLRIADLSGRFETAGATNVLSAPSPDRSIARYTTMLDHQGRFLGVELPDEALGRADAAVPVTVILVDDGTGTDGGHHEPIGARIVRSFRFSPSSCSSQL